MIRVVLLSICIGICVAMPELLKNADFESSSYSGNWICNGRCHFANSHDAVSGHSSVEITHRTHNWAGLTQSVPGQEGHRYFFKGQIRLLNLAPGHMFHRVELMSKYTRQDGHGGIHTIGILPMVKPSDGWVEVSGDYIFPSTNNGHIQIYIQIAESQVNYRFDAASVQELPDDTDWKTRANARIETIRKAPINIQVHNTGSLDTSHLSIELEQTKSSFAFGAAVDASLIVDPGSKAYQDFFYNNFEWAVLTNSLKWRLMEFSKGHPNFDKPMQAIKSLRAKGVQVRGHNMFWGVSGHTPSWIEHMSSNDLLHEMHTHVNDMISHTRGTLEHWDVNNENLHGSYFEQHTSNPNITMDMFNWIHQLEPGVKLFLNDYNVITISQYTAAMKNQANLFHKSGTPIYGVGLQSHIRFFPIDMTALEYRLNKVAECGLPLWITELTLQDRDVNVKASSLEDVLTLYFSHPNVEGVLFWGFWDGRMGNAAASLAHGSHVTPNAAGQKLNQLVKQKWRTHQTVSMANNQMHVFKGEYTLRVKKNGNTVESHNFTLSNAATITVNLSGSGSHVSTSTTIH